MGIVCMFRMCKWLHICNTEQHGIYQCSRCKTISKGVRRGRTPSGKES